MTTTTVRPSSPSLPPKTSPLELHARRLFSAGQRMFAQSEWQAAARLFELVLKVNPDHTLARRYLGEALLEMGEIKPALRHLHQVYRDDPEKGRQVFRKALQALSKDVQEGMRTEMPLADASPDGPADAPEVPEEGEPQDNPEIIRPHNAPSLHEIEVLGRGRIVAFTYLAHGDTLAVGTSIGVYLYDAVSMAVLRFLPASAWVWSIACSPDERTLAIGLEDGRVLLWDALDDDQPPRELSAHDSAVRVVAFSPDGGVLASGSISGMVRLWHTERHTLLRTIRSSKGEVRSLAFSSDGSLLALASLNRHVQVRRVRDGALLYTLHGHRQAVCSVTFTSDDRLIAASGEDGRINLWKVGEEYPARTIKDFMGVVKCVAFSPDNRLLASASWDGIVRLWRPGDGSIWRRMEEQGNPIVDCAFSPDGRTLTTLTINEEAVRVWNVHNGELLKSLTHINALLCVSVSSAQDYLAAGTRDGRVLVWSWPVQGSAPDVTLAGHQTAVRNLAFSSSGEYLVSGGDDPYLMVWKLSHSAARRLNLPRDSGTVNRVCFSLDGDWLFAATQGGRVYCWDARDLWEASMLPIAPRVWAQFSHSVTALDYPVAGGLLVAGTDDGRGYVWQVSNGVLLHTLEREMGALRAAVISSDGQHLALAGNNGRIYLWGAYDGEYKRTITAHKGLIRALAFSPDGRVLASAGVDGCIRLWQVEDGAPLGTFQGHTSQIWQVAFSSDGKRLLSSGDDGTLRIWKPSV